MFNDSHLCYVEPGLVFGEMAVRVEEVVERFSCGRCGHIVQVCCVMETVFEILYERADEHEAHISLKCNLRNLQGR